MSIRLEDHVTFNELPIERMSTEELQMRAGIDIGRDTNDITRELIAITKMLREAKRKRSDAKLAKIRRDEGAEEAYEVAKLVVDVIGDRARMLRELKSIQQTLARAIP